MDPVTISTIVVKVTGICLSTAKALYEIRIKYNDASITIVTLCSETTVISASLSCLQTLVCQKPDLVQLLDAKPELLHAIDAALIGCMVLLSCLEEETRKITATSSTTGVISWRGRARIIWNHEKLQELLNGLRGQQLAINLLIQLLQVDSLEAIRQLLSQNRPVMTESIRTTKLLKQSHPDLRVPQSICSSDDALSIDAETLSIAGDSALEFEFDDEIANSKVYRRVPKSAKARISMDVENDRGVIMGDLIDFSEPQTTLTGEENPVTQDLEALIIPRYDESMTNLPVVSYPTDNRQKSPAMVSQKQLRRAGAQTSDSLAIPSRRPNLTELPVLEHISSSSIDSKRGSPIQNIRSSKEDGRHTKFGDYHIGTNVGVGDRSKVKLCWKVEGGPQVAIKFIHKKSTRNALPSPVSFGNLHKIYREVAILGGVSHPNIIQLHEMVTAEDRVGIVLGYASGGELYEYISKIGHLKDPAAARLFAQLVSGLGYLHKKGIAHRNLSLRNLLLDRDRNIIIAGFGSANMFNSEDKLSPAVKAEMLSEGYTKQAVSRRHAGDLMRAKCGEPIYMAPEVMALSDGSLYTSRQADVWSCGVILYAMVAGYEPFKDDPANPESANIDLLYRYINTTKLCFPSYVTTDVRELLRRILVPDPLKRADLLEIARHSWISRYASLVWFITRDGPVAAQW